MASGLLPLANSRKKRWTMAASSASIVRSVTVALARRDGPVAVGEPAGDAAFEHPAEFATLRLLAQVLQRHLGHHPHDGDMDRRDLAHGRREQPHPVERQLILQIGRVSEASPKSVDGLADHDVEGPLARRRQETLKGRSKPARTADRRVGDGINDCPSLPGRIAPADLKLILDGRVALKVRRMPGLDHRAHESLHPLPRIQRDLQSLRRPDQDAMPVCC